MARQSRFSPETFLADVQQQLTGLDVQEQREILEELRDHLEDSALRLAEGGASREVALERAGAEMGDPADVGRRLHDEHMAVSLPIRYGLLAAMPLFVCALYLELFRLLLDFLASSGQRPTWVLLVTPAAVSLLVLCVGLWVLRRGRNFLAAPFVGIAAAWGLAWSFVSLQSWLAIGTWVSTVLAFVPALVLLAWWGRLSGNLMLLGAVGALAIFTWMEIPLGLLKLTAYFGVCLGIVALVALPRRWQPTAAWIVLLMDWSIVALGKWYSWYLLAYEAPREVIPDWRATHPPTIGGIWGEMPLAVLTMSVALLFATQYLASLQTRRSGSLVRMGP